MAGLTEMPKVGDKVRYLGGSVWELTAGETYIIEEVDALGDAQIRDDNGIPTSIQDSYGVCDFDKYELIAEDSEPQPDVTELIANLGRRLHDIERLVPHHRHNAMLDFEFIYEEIAALKGEPYDSVDVEPDTSDAVNPSHYKQGAVEVIDYIDQVADGYEGKQAVYAGNIIKYVSRAPYKNQAQDIRKAIWYAQRLADAMEAKVSE